MRTDTKRVNISLSPTAHDFLLRVATKDGVSLSNLVASVVLHKAVQLGLPQEALLRYRAMSESNAATTKRAPAKAKRTRTKRAPAKRSKRPTQRTKY